MPSLGESFDTERMHLRLLEERDLYVVHRQFSDPDMCRYFSEPPMNLETARATIEFFRHPERDPYLRYGMFEKTTGEFIGTCGYHHYDPERRQTELGYDVWKAFWRNGYVSEAVRALIPMCFAELEIDQVYVLIDEANQASIGTAKKLGFRMSNPCRPLDDPAQVCMKLTDDDWNAKRSVTNDC
jgi:[ribosomal protein S5]-alanine N-acetyltransferase